MSNQKWGNKWCHTFVDLKSTLESCGPIHELYQNSSCIYAHRNPTSPPPPVERKMGRESKEKIVSEQPPSFCHSWPRVAEALCLVFFFCLRPKHPVVQPEVSCLILIFLFFETASVSYMTLLLLDFQIKHAFMLIHDFSADSYLMLMFHSSMLILWAHWVAILSLTSISRLGYHNLGTYLTFICRCVWTSHQHYYT